MRKSIIVYVIFGVLFFSLVISVYALTQMFSVNKITILGNKEFMYNDILKLAEIEVGQSIMSLDEELVQSRIERNALIEFVSLTRKLPDEVTMVVRERQPIAFIDYLTSSILLDENGVALDVRNTDAVHNYIRVRGLRIQSFVLGKELFTENVHRLDSLKRVLSEIKVQDLVNEIQEILVSDPNNISMISDGGLKIKLGQAINLDEKLAWLHSEQFSLDGEQVVPGELDLSVHTQAVFRPLENRGE